MNIGDRVKLHISSGRRDALNLPDEIGTISDIDKTGAHASVLVHFKDQAVYLSSFDESEIEIVGSNKAGQGASPEGAGQLGEAVSSAPRAEQPAKQACRSALGADETFSAALV